MALKSYVSDNGLPRAVATVDALPSHAFVGHLCYVESEDAIYRFNGESYAVVSSSDDGAITVQGYPGYSKFPSNATVGQLAYSTIKASKGLYVYNGSSWDKLALASEITTTS